MYHAGVVMVKCFAVSPRSHWPKVGIPSVGLVCLLESAGQCMRAKRPTMLRDPRPPLVLDATNAFQSNKMRGSVLTTSFDWPKGGEKTYISHAEEMEVRSCQLDLHHHCASLQIITSGNAVACEHFIPAFTTCVTRTLKCSKSARHRAMRQLANVGQKTT